MTLRFNLTSEAEKRPRPPRLPQTLSPPCIRNKRTVLGVTTTDAIAAEAKQAEAAAAAWPLRRLVTCPRGSDEPTAESRRGVSSRSDAAAAFACTTLEADPRVDWLAAAATAASGGFDGAAGGVAWSVAGGRSLGGDTRFPPPGVSFAAGE